MEYRTQVRRGGGLHCERGEQMKEQTIIVLRETVAESLISDLGTFLTAAAIIGLGVYLQSSAMQWTGAVVFFLLAIGRSARKRQEKTIAQARAYLDELDASK